MNLNAVYGLFYIFLAIKWGDWKNWKAYYPTILFLMVGDLVYQFLLFNHSMWEYVPVGSDEAWAKHTHIAILIMLIKYPCTLLVFLGNLPSTYGRKLLYIIGWTILYTINEFLDLKMGALVHKNGWNLCWSAFFSFVMFFVLYIHYKNPLFAWILATVYAVFLWNIFHISPNTLK